MTMSDNYYFVDGSSLLSDIQRYKRDNSSFSNLKLDLARYSSVIQAATMYFTGKSFRRFVYYFVKDDARIATELILPDFTKPNTVIDLAIEYCGKNIKDRAPTEKWLIDNNAPQFVMDHTHRSEKAVDTQICCDALRLAAVRKIDRLFLYTNDYDFFPLCQTLRQLGINVNLFRLSAAQVNKDLVQICDGYSVLPQQTLVECFS